MRCGRGLGALFVGVVFGTLAVLPAGCGFGGQGQITLGYLLWDENVANSYLIRVLLEDEFGYENVELQRSEKVPDVFDAVAEGETDVFMDAWMPNHRQFVDEAGDKVEVYREPWYEGKTVFGVAVPNYMEGIETIGDLKSSEPGMITGIEPGATLMEKIGQNAVPQYDLDYSLVEASTPAMLLELQKAYSMREPFVFVAWSPHWMNLEYDFRYLKDPKNALGTADDPQTLHTVARKGFAEDDPVAHALISEMRLDSTQVGSLEVAINQAVDEEREIDAGVRDWLEESENRSAVQPWIDAARQAERG
ncbi:glycine betaine ABC transporter substrate-binding protein [Rubrobacter tropicus]|uniref:glycine betaine ABC transporter substrate-binding protein n=1 Tax=Rubrobacter tropicus TaxID=2653851 RepID=UPI00140C8EB0|nr:glycine betaine ABC transporter substrate-binding protein [Rubrobacter tropicus]